jgi:hypothetical protein
VVGGGAGAVAAGAGGCGFGFRPHAALPTAAIRTTAAHMVNLRIIKLFSSSCLHVARTVT